jgi:hypothetical protein
MARSRMTLMIDRDMLANAHKASGKKTYSETVNDALREAARVAKFRRALQQFDEHRDEFFTPGYREEFWLERGNPEMARAVREEEAAKRR